MSGLKRLAPAGALLIFMGCAHVVTRTVEVKVPIQGACVLPDFLKTNPPNPCGEGIKCFSDPKAQGVVIGLTKDGAERLKAMMTILNRRIRALMELCKDAADDNHPIR